MLKVLLILLLSQSANAIDNSQKERAKEAGVEIQYEHNSKRTYLANDQIALDTEIEYAKAIRWSMASEWSKTAKIYIKLANRGHPVSQVHLGKQYVHGNGVPMNLIEAYKWFLLSETAIADHYINLISEDMEKEEIDEAKRIATNFIASYN